MLLKLTRILYHIRVIVVKCPIGAASEAVEPSAAAERCIAGDYWRVLAREEMRST